jgi:hydroxyacyl-ACP dehydratase HTD2-like protein with hotdog domain
VGVKFDRSIVGQKGESQDFDVERGAIRRFAEAIGDENPVHRAGDIAPPTFPTTFHVRNPDLGFARDPSRLLLSGGEEYIYERPLRAGDRITCVSRIVDTYVKQGRRGEMAFVVFEKEGRDPANALVFRARHTLIYF